MAKDNKKKCIKCTDMKNVEKDFYADLTPNSINADKRVTVCKQCLWSMTNPKDLDSVKDALKIINRPFINHLWDSTIEESKNKNEDSAFKWYMKNLQMRQYRHLTWEDSIFKSKVNNEDSEVYIDDEDDFFVTADLIKKWGRNFQSDDYYKLEDFYNKMMISNKIESPQDETYLKKLSMISLKMDKELEEGNYAQVKQLGDLFSKYMADSKFRAMDQTDASKTGGLRTFSQIYAEVEKDGFIPPWEEYQRTKGLKQDIVDKTIMYILNYTLKLNKVSQLTSPPSDTPKIDEEDFNE